MWILLSKISIAKNVNESISFNMLDIGPDDASNHGEFEAKRYVK